jgi:hypothetical protein
MSTSHKGKSNSRLGTHLTEEHRKKLSETHKGDKHPSFGKHLSEEHRRKIGEAQKGEKGNNYGKHLTEKHRNILSKANKGKHFSKETIRKRVESRKNGKGWIPSEETRRKISETLLGGFWYGNVRYVGKKYCELWNSNLWRRIDAYQNYKSILSGKTKADNGGITLSRHHVYWQEKACCVWDEDAQGYYAMINIGTAKRPNMYKYYVGDDPNKFVLLTKSEHGMIAKDKIKWIKIFEDLIKKQGGKCYYTKEEFKAISGKNPLIKGCG